MKAEIEGAVAFATEEIASAPGGALAATPPLVTLDDLNATPLGAEQWSEAARAPSATSTGSAGSGMRSARVTAIAGRSATIALRGRADPIDAMIAPEVDPAVIQDALDGGDSVLVELFEGEAPLIVGALHTRRPQEIRLKAAVVHIEGDQEVVLRSGRGAVRIRADGDIEVIGSRISAASRGLFRIVGRMLRLN
jgi:hypothetical protein